MTYIPADLRRLVIERAEGRCEYCLMHVADRLLPFEIDHVIAEKHGGGPTRTICAWRVIVVTASKGATSPLRIRRQAKRPSSITRGANAGQTIFA